MVTGFCNALDAKMLPNECSTFLIYDFSSNLYFSQKEFLDHLKKALTSTKTLTESAAVVCVKLCKVATYMKPEDNSVLCFLVVTMLNELKVLSQKWYRNALISLMLDLLSCKKDRLVELDIGNEYVRVMKWEKFWSSL